MEASAPSSSLLDNLLRSLRKHAAPLPERHVECAEFMPLLAPSLRNLLVALWRPPSCEAGVAQLSEASGQTLDLLALVLDTTHCRHGLLALGPTPVATVSVRGSRGRSSSLFSTCNERAALLAQ